MRFRTIPSLFLILPIIIFLYFIFLGIQLPFVGPNAGNFSAYSLMAHNFNQFGYLETKFAPIISVAPTLPEKPEYFFHHPTLLSFVESLLFRIFGEEFWVGRLSVILFAIGSFVLIYFIAKILVNKKYALMSLWVSALIPVFTIWGKMVGQEPLVLFFGLLAVFAALKYFTSEKRIFIWLCSIAIILGIWSDWPMAFFILCFFPFFVKYKKIKIGILLIALSVVVTGCLLIYVYFMQSGFWDLKNALAMRSVTGLLEIPYWPIKWIISTFSRLAIYFNPILFVLSLVSLFGIYKKFRQKKFSNIDLVILGFFLFAFIHIVIYAQGVFTHPYLLYYWVPFVVFGSSVILIKLLRKRSYFVILIILFSFVYLLTLQKFKHEQIMANIWKYDLIHAISVYTVPYEEVLLDNGFIINTDILWFPFSLNWRIDPRNDSWTWEFIEKNQHYVYSCERKCTAEHVRLKDFKQRYNFVHIVHPEAEAYVFFIKQKKEQKAVQEVKLPVKYTRSETTKYLLQIYRNMRDKLSLYQF
jgi:4-amino-4-deoxy-L-arabinose transferase-like glycosyltransferase